MGVEDEQHYHGKYIAELIKDDTEEREEAPGVSIGKITRLDQMAKDIQSNLDEGEGYFDIRKEMWIFRLQGFIAGVAISIICYFLLK
jgi:hypothetical protein